MKSTRFLLGGRRHRRVLHFALFAVGVLTVVSCTLLGSRELIQCRTNADCVTSPFPNAVCSSGLCAAGSASIDAQPPVDGGEDAAGPACVASSECGIANRCIAGHCRQLTESFDPTSPTAAGCFEILPNNPSIYRNDDAILIGAYVNVGSRIDSEPGARVLSHALDEINSASSRPVVAIVCRKDVAPGGRPGRVIDFLSSLKVPLVVGQFNRGDIQAESVHAREANVAIWSTLSNTKSIRSIDSSGFVRFFLDDIESVRDGYQAALDLATARITAEAETPKLAVIIGTDQESSDLADEITTGTNRLTLDGTPLSDANYDRLLFKDTPAGRVTGGPKGTPNIVIALGGDEYFSPSSASPLLVEKVEQSTPVIWIFGPRMRFAMQNLDTAFKTDASRARVLGVEFSGDRGRHATFVRELTKNKPDWWNGAAYDALYDALYAVAYAGLYQSDGGSPVKVLTAADMNAHLGAFFPDDFDASTNPVIEVGVGAGVFANGSNRMAVGDRVRFMGATGPLEWERVDGRISNHRTMGTSLFCMRSKSDSSKVPLVFYGDVDSVADAGGGCAQK